MLHLTKHKKLKFEKNSNFETTLNFTPPTILPNLPHFWPLLPPGRGLVKHEKKRFFFQIARKSSKSDYITLLKRLEDAMIFFSKNGSI